MAQFVGEIPDPNDPESVAEWARGIANLLNGQLSIGEPISQDTTMFPNGVKGHLVGSFVVRSDIVLADTAYTFTHNLNIPNKGAGNDPLNVCWEVVRFIHDGTNVNAASTLSVNYDSRDAAGVLDNSIDLRFYVGGARTIAAPNPLTAALWFFPTTQ